MVALARTTYADLNDTHLSEVLAEVEGIVVSRSTVRRLRLAAGLVRPRQRRPAAHRHRRARCLHRVIDRDPAQRPAQRTKRRGRRAVTHAEHIAHHRHALEPRAGLVMTHPDRREAEGAPAADAAVAVGDDLGEVCVAQGFGDRLPMLQVAPCAIGRGTRRHGGIAVGLDGGRISDNRMAWLRGRRQLRTLPFSRIPPSA